MIYIIGAIICGLILVLVKAYLDETPSGWDD